jgi:hypothetical protein
MAYSTWRLRSLGQYIDLLIAIAGIVLLPLAYIMRKWTSISG